MRVAGVVGLVAVVPPAEERALQPGGAAGSAARPGPSPAPATPRPQGRLAALDLSPASPLHEALLLEGTAPLRTVYEDCFGLPLADVNYLADEARRSRPAAGRVYVAC
jgi:hypothetical protein